MQPGAAAGDEAAADGVHVFSDEDAGWPGVPVGVPHGEYPGAARSATDRAGDTVVSPAHPVWVTRRTSWQRTLKA